MIKLVPDDFHADKCTLLEKVRLELASKTLFWEFIERRGGLFTTQALMEMVDRTEAYILLNMISREKHLTDKGVILEGEEFYYLHSEIRKPENEYGRAISLTRLGLILVNLNIIGLISRKRIKGLKKNRFYYNINFSRVIWILQQAEG